MALTGHRASLQLGRWWSGHIAPAVWSPINRCALLRPRALRDRDGVPDTSSSRRGEDSRAVDETPEASPSGTETDGGVEWWEAIAAAAIKRWEPMTQEQRGYTVVAAVLALLALPRVLTFALIAVERLLVGILLETEQLLALLLLQSAKLGVFVGVFVMLAYGLYVFAFKPKGKA